MSDDEGLVEVTEILLDSTSMQHYRKMSNTMTGTSSELQTIIENVIRTRGKCHNPYTNSGGVLIGHMKKKGSGFDKGTNRNVAIGDLVSPPASVSAIPLSIKHITNIEGNRVFVKGGIAVVFSCMELVSIPSDLGKDLALVAIDISSLVPQVRRTMHDIVKKNMADSIHSARVLVIGCGVAGLAALHTVSEVVNEMHALQNSLPSENPNHFDHNPFILESFALDYSHANVAKIRDLGFDEELFKLQQGDVKDTAMLHDMVGETCDLVINVVNAPDTETATVYCCKPSGTVFWFSMGSRFDKAALATDALGKDVKMIIGNGIADKQIEQSFELVRKYPKLREYYSSH